MYKLPVPPAATPKIIVLDPSPFKSPRKEIDREKRPSSHCFLYLGTK